jgi:HEAT repeat protein
LEQRTKRFFSSRNGYALSRSHAEQVTLLIADLDSSQFAIRQQAREELVKIGDAAVMSLRKKLTEKSSLEVHKQIEELLAKIEQTTLDSLRGVRAVEVLEHIGNPDARKVLESLATGAEGARLTKEAKASLGRLNKRVVME